MLAVITPTTKDRGRVFGEFHDSWADLFKKHNALIITVFDGDKQYLLTSDGVEETAETLLSDDKDLIYTHDTACKNLGLAYVLKRTNVDKVLILDDDVRPIGDPIQDHLSILGQKTPLSWMTTMYPYPRGMPYSIRDEAEVTVSHGVWDGVPDLDAPTQLVNGVTDYYFPKFIVPKDILIPFCGMNVMLDRKAIPYLYFAPPYKGEHEHFNRADDIFGGIMLKRKLDNVGQTIATGYARVRHDRASNVFSNLHKEALFIKLNESFWKGDTEHPYFIEYLEKYARWQSLFQKCNV